jgi:hypothetical protein
MPQFEVDALRALISLDHDETQTIVNAGLPDEVGEGLSFPRVLG